MSHQIANLICWKPVALPETVTFSKILLLFLATFSDECNIKLYLLFQRRKKKTPTPIRTRNKIPPMTPPTIALVFDFFSLGAAKTANENIRKI